MLLPGAQHHQPSARTRMLLGRCDEPTTPRINIRFEKQYKQTPNARLRPFRSTAKGSGWQGIDRIR